MLEYNHAETRYDYFDSDNSCFDNVRNSTMDRKLSLVTCKMTVDNACKTKVCVPFCCGNIYVYKEYGNATEELTCHYPNEVIKIHELTQRKLLNLMVLENYKEVPILDSTMSPYYLRKILDGKCNVAGVDEYLYTDIPSQHPSLAYSNSSGAYLLKLNDSLLTPNDYCIISEG